MNTPLEKKSYLQRATETLKSQAAKIAGALAIVAALSAASPAQAQTIEKKK